MVSKNIMNLISLGIHIFPILIKFLLCFGRALLISEVGEGGLLRSLELGWPHTGGQFWASPVWVYRPPPGKHRSALPGSQAGMLVPGGRCWVLGVAHL